MTATLKQQASWNQRDARVVHMIARASFERFLCDPTEENRFDAIYDQNSASDYYHCALYCNGVVDWVVKHPGEPTLPDAPGTSYSDFTPVMP